MNRHKLHRIVEYIRKQSDFPFDTFDVGENVEVVTTYFGLHPELDDTERSELQRELGWLASEAQLAEVARQADLLEEGTGLGRIRQMIHDEGIVGVSSRSFA